MLKATAFSWKNGFCKIKIDLLEQEDSLKEIEMYKNIIIIVFKLEEKVSR
jgi:hypothetical protein